MTSQPEHFDYILLGSGAGAKALAWTLLSKRQGKKCAIIEHSWNGGSCPNVACLPSKNFVNSANIAHLARHAQSYGLGALMRDKVASATADMSIVRARKAAMVDEEVELHVAKFASTGAELIRGHGKFIGLKTLEVSGSVLVGEVVVIGTGSRAVVDSSIPGLQAAKPLTHVEILDLDTLPSHLIILGGGYVGMEFAQAFRRFGSEVTVIQRNAQVLKNEDEDIVSALVEILGREGIKFLTSTTVTSVSGVSGEGVVVTTSGQNAVNIRGSHLLVAAGRAPNTSGIGLAEAGVELTGAGHVAVNEQLQTSAPGVFAVGDCAGSPYFTHIGYDDFRIIHSNLTGAPRPAGKNNRQVPSTLFTSPELAHVGLREREAKTQGIKYRLVRVPMGTFLRTRTHGQMDGFVKALVEADGNQILGFTALGAGAGELLPVVQLAMKLSASYKEIADLVIAHPTMNEGLIALFSGVLPRV